MLEAIVDLIISNRVGYDMLLGDNIQSKVGFIKRIYRLLYSNDEHSLSSVFGDAILVHNRWNMIITQTIFLPDRIMTLDLNVSQTISRTLVVLFLPIHGTMT